MPKEVQPLENAAKIYYATTFPLDLSLLLLERKSTTLQHMFTDFLEVEENLEMSKLLSSQGNNGEVKDTLKWVGPYKQNERVPVSLNPSLSIQKDDQPDTGTCDPPVLFSEDCNLRHLGSVQDNFKKEFSAPVFDEYEEEYLWAIPEKLAIEPGPTGGEGQDAM